MSKKNNTPEQKAAWAENRKAPKRGRILNIIPSGAYRPQPKAPSRRDLIRAGLRKKGKQ